MNTESLAKDQAEVISYHKANGWTVYQSKIAKVIFAARPFGEGKINVKAWRGDARVSCWNYLFRSEDRAEKYCAEFARQVAATDAARLKTEQDRKAKRAALRAADHWTVGDVVYTSWGYDQTNVEYFQIVALKPRSVVVRQIAENCSDHGQPGGGRTAPRRNGFVGPEFICPLDVNGNFSAGPCHRDDKPSFRHRVSKWCGRAVYTSSTH